MATPDWFAVYTKHNHEKKAAELLSGKGIEVFLPLFQSSRPWNDRTKILSLPLFPSYLFIHSDLHNKGIILNTPGVFSLVGSAGRACPIASSEIDAIRKLGHTIAHVEPYPFLEEGDSVRVKSGPLAGIDGILVRQKNQFRIILSISLLRRSVSIEIDISNVEKSKATHKMAKLCELQFSNQPYLKYE